MSEALISETGFLPSESTELLVSRNGSDPYRARTAGECPKLPTVRPGQLWYVELPRMEPALSPLEYEALTTANVVIYDRALAPAMAGLLRIGGYAEPAAPSDGAPDVALERCLRFARDGWSVVRLVDPTRGQAGMIRQLSERLLGVKAPVALPVLVFANTGGSYEKSETDSDEFGEVIEDRGFGQSVALTIIISGIEVEAAPRFTVASTNGLAG